MRGKDFHVGDGLRFAGITPAYAGKGTRKRAHMRTRRITPAYAGKSVKRDELARVERDHPRVCGEK